MKASKLIYAGILSVFLYSENIHAQGSYTQVSFVNAAEKSVNSVVHINTKATKEGEVYYNPFGEFFGNPYQKMPDQHIQGSGSGVIISADGKIATNFHVIKDATEIEVTLNDKRKFNATIVGSDPSTDLALIKIDASGLTPIAMGNSDAVRIGEWVLAVGNPFNLTSTVTAGIVSAKGRNIHILKDQYAIESFIQTDAAVNPGNSGGALVNTNGELIGINTAIASTTGSYAGYAFAIPVNLVQKVMNDLAKYGTVQRALLGVQITDVTQEAADKNGLKTLEGVLLGKVFENSAAGDANLEEGDIITKINGEPVKTTTFLQEKISQYRPGDKVKITYLREGKEAFAEVTLKNAEGTGDVVEKEVMFLGAKLEKLSSKEKKEYGIENGVKIKELQNGKLLQNGIKKGFIITHIDHKPMSAPDEVIEILKNKKGGVLIEGIYPSGTRGYYGFGL